MTIKLSKQIGNNFCFAPWTNLHISTEGHIKTCCSGMPLGNIRQDSIIDVYNSEKFKSIQTALVNNEVHDNCKECIQKESNGGTSERAWHWPSNPNDIIEIADIHEQKYISIDLRWNTVCDLSCTYCDERFSATWAKLKNVKHDTFYSKNNTELIYDHINSHKEIKQINLAGGEPLLIKENIKLFDVINGADTKLYIISNFATDVKTNKVFQKLLEIENDFQIDISFDTVGNKFEYVRHGGNWSRMLDNIRYTQEQIQLHKPNSNLSITSIYSIYNALDLYDFVKYLKDNDLPRTRWNWLNHPHELDVLNLPDSFKKSCLEQLQQTNDIFPDSDDTFFKTMAGTISTNTSQNTTCDYLYQWHHQQEETFWPNSALKFKDLWPEFYRP